LPARLFQFEKFPRLFFESVHPMDAVFDALSGPQFSGTVDFDLLQDLGLSASDYSRFTIAATPVDPPRCEAGKRRREDGDRSEPPRTLSGKRVQLLTAPTPDQRSSPPDLPPSGTGLAQQHSAPPLSDDLSAVPSGPLIPPAPCEAVVVCEQHAASAASEFELEALVRRICGTLAEENRLSVLLAVQALGLHGAQRLFDDTLRAEVSCPRALPALSGHA
jgi:hypothetical protein